jgi:hypothetical protein
MQFAPDLLRQAACRLVRHPVDSGAARPRGGARGGHRCNAGRTRLIPASGPPRGSRPGGRRDTATRPVIPDLPDRRRRCCSWHDRLTPRMMTSGPAVATRRTRRTAHPGRPGGPSHPADRAHLQAPSDPPHSADRAPAGPAGPVAPGRPRAPGSPAGPAGPAGPIGPRGPAGPGYPVCASNLDLARSTAQASAAWEHTPTCAPAN